jgi:small membrane protein
MTVFQWIAIPPLLLLVVATVAATARRRLRLRVGLFWSLVWIGSATAIRWPDLTVRAARLVGIGRGADLVLYLAVGVMLVGFFLVFLRLRRIEEDLTKIVRALALQKPYEPTETPPRDE